MEFIHHTIQWTRGEIFEASLIGLFGVLTLVVAGVFWKFGDTPASRALLVPLLVLGLLCVAVGGASYVNNQRRIPQFERAYAEDPAAFVQSEKARVEGFQYMYTIVLVVASLSFAAAAILFWFSLNPHLRAVGIALILLGLAGLTIDFFSKERADRYYEKIEAELGSSDT